jgi:hypothetical protein
MGDLFDIESAKGAPMVAAIIVAIAVLLLAGFSFGFQGSVQF